jgi:hypothetical protein
MTEPTQRRKFDKALLDECIKRDGATLIGEYENINMDSKIKFTCYCGIENIKGFRCIFNYIGAKCRK